MIPIHTTTFTSPVAEVNYRQTVSGDRLINPTYVGMEIKPLQSGEEALLSPQAQAVLARKDEKIATLEAGKAELLRVIADLTRSRPPAGLRQNVFGTTED